MRIGITGSDGFIGYHTYNNLKFTTKYDVVKLDKDLILEIFQIQSLASEMNK